MFSFTPRRSTRDTKAQLSEKDIEVKTKNILEPEASATSLKFIRDDEQDEKDKDEVYDTAVPEDKLAHSMKRFAFVRAVHNLLIGDQSATTTQLTVMYDWELDNKFVQKVLIESRGVEILINILETDQVKCHIGVLRIIEKMSSNNKIRLLLANLGALSSILSIMRTGFIDVRIAAAKALDQLCRVQKPARYLRKAGGIPILLNCLDVHSSLLNTPYELLTMEQQDIITLAIAATSTLKQVCMFHKTAESLYKHGICVVMQKITNSCHKDLLKEFFGLLSSCSKHDLLRRAIEIQGIILQLIEGLKDENEELRRACASTIATCAADSHVTRHMVRLLQGLPDIVELTRNVKQEDATLAAVTLAASKLAQDSRNLKIMSEKGLARNLVKFMTFGMNDEIITNVVECLAECGRLEENAQVAVNTGVIPSIIQHLMGVNPTVLSSAAQCLGAFARHSEVAKTIMEFGGMRLLFSVLRNSNPSVVATALWALKPLVHNYENSAEEIRCLIGGIDILIGLLHFPDLSVKANACGLIAEVAKDPENLQIMSDTGVVPSLAECALETNEELRISAAEAIANTGMTVRNGKEFALLGAPVVVSRYLLSSNPDLHLKAMQALASLTKIPHNCILLHECGGVQPVIADIASPSRELQELVTVVLKNMRQVALTGDKKIVDTCNIKFYAPLTIRRIKKKRVKPEIARKIETNFFLEAIRELKTSRHPNLHVNTHSSSLIKIK